MRMSIKTIFLFLVGVLDVTSNCRSLDFRGTLKEACAHLHPLLYDGENKASRWGWTIKNEVKSKEKEMFILTPKSHTN